MIDKLDRDIINILQAGFPLTETPYADVAAQLNIDEEELLKRLARLLEDRILTRFGPMYDVQKLGGAFSLVAIQVPENKFDKVADVVNSYPEVAHNYQRDHDFNMWYVLATETPQQIDKINHDIEKRIGLKVFNMPRLEEYFVGLQLQI